MKWPLGWRHDDGTPNWAMTGVTEPQPYSAEEMPKVLAELRRPSLGNIRHLEVGPEDGLRLAATLSSLLEDQKRLLRAIVDMAIPYEALRADGGSRKWIAPEVWKHIVEATERARQEVAARSPVQHQQKKEGRP